MPGLSAALLNCFLERRITCIMYSLGGLCIVCCIMYSCLARVFVKRACGDGIFWHAEQGWRGGQPGEKMLVPPLETLDILGSRGYNTNMYKKGA